MTKKEKVLLRALAVWAIVVPVTLGWVTYSTHEQLESLRSRLESSTVQLEADLRETNEELVEQIAEVHSGLADDLSILKTVLSDCEADLEAVSQRFAQIKYESDVVASNEENIMLVRGYFEAMRTSLAGISNRLCELEEYLYSGSAFVAVNNFESGFEPDCQWLDVYGNKYIAQQFTVGTQASDVCRVKLYCKRVAGTPKTVRLDIYQVTSIGLPIGSALTSVIVDASEWGEAPAWHNFVLVSYPLAPNWMYAVVLHDDDGDINSRIAVGYNEADVYSGGKRVESVDGGKTWHMIGGDMGFEVWGIKRGS